MLVSFCRELAVKYGLVHALILESIAAGIRGAFVNDRNQMDGYYYAAFSVDALHNHFVYIDKTIVDTVVDEMRNTGLIEVREEKGMLYARIPIESLREVLKIKEVGEYHGGL